MAMQQMPQGLQALMPQQRPVQQPRPAMPSVDPQRMQAAVDVVDNDLQDLGVDPKTRAAMKAQEAVDLLKSADQDLAKAQGQQVPQMPVIDQRKQQAAEGIIGLMQRLMPGAQMARMGQPQRPQPQRRAAPNMLAGLGGMQRRPQPQARQQRPMAAGMPQLPAPNMRMADGGIVGYAPGGDVEGETAQIQQLDPFNNLMSEEYNELANDSNVQNYMSIEQQVERYKAAGDMESARMESENLKTFPADTIIKVQRLKTLIAGGNPDAELAYGGEVKKYAGPEGSFVGANNPFNIRDYNQNWQGQTGATRGFVDFEDVASSVRAADRLLSNYPELGGVATLRETVSRYAPPNENDTDNYLKFVSEQTGIPTDAPIDLTDPSVRRRILSAIAKMESGTDISPNQMLAMLEGRNPDRETVAAQDSRPSNDYIDDELEAEIQAILAARPERDLPPRPTYMSSAERREQRGDRTPMQMFRDFMASQEEKAEERERRRDEFNTKIALANRGLTKNEIGQAMGNVERRREQAAQPETPRGVPLDLSKPPSRTATRGTDLENSGIVANLFTPQQGAVQPAPTTPTDPAQDIINRMRTEATNIGNYQRTPSDLETQLEEVLGEQLGAMEGARATEEAAARAALGMSDVEKQAVEDLIKADEAYYGKILSPRERARRQNELIAQAYMSGNSLVDQARRSSAAQSQLRRQQQQQEREAAKVRPQATVELEQAQRGIRGQVYEAGRGAEQTARTTLNQAIQSAGNYVNTIANRDAEMAIQQSRANLDVLKAEIDSVLTARQLDDAAEGRLMTLYANLDRNIMTLDGVLADMESDPLAKADDKTRVRNYITELRGIKQATMNDIARQIGLPAQRVSRILGAGAGEGSTGDPEIDALVERYTNR